MIMAKKKISNNYLIITLASFSYFVAIFLHRNFSPPKIEISKQDSAININRDFLKFFSLGNKRLLGNLVWIQTLLESDLEKYSGEEKNSWMYHRFRTISELDPLFYHNYLWGGMYLSIIKDDLEGASDIYERGLLYYPHDYDLNYNIGFNYYFEMGNLEKGLEHLQKVEDSPRLPKPLKFVIHKLKFAKSGDFNAALAMLEHNLKKTEEPIIKKKLEADIYGLKAERDLKCLNEGGELCNRTDAEGNAYIYREGKFRAAKKFNTYRLHRHQRKK
jgi:tetratricopeptide (TPR) repeat protein